MYDLAESPPRLDINIPKRYRLSNKDKYIVYKFHELECPSPYQDSSSLHPASAEAEKRAVLLVQELLSLTLEKRILVDHLTHFRKEFKFSNQVGKSSLLSLGNIDIYFVYSQFHNVGVAWEFPLIIPSCFGS